MGNFRDGTRDRNLLPVLLAGLLLCLPGAVSAQDTIAAGDTAALRDTSPAADTISEVAPEHWPRVMGRLTDATTGEPIAGATLRLAELDVSAVSGSGGRFVLPRVPPGTHEMEIRHVGYGTRTVGVTVRADVTTRLQLRLEPEAVEVEPIEVRVEFRPEYLQDEGFYERMERGWGNYVDPEHADELFGSTVKFDGRGDLLEVVSAEFSMPTRTISRRGLCAKPEGWAVFVDGRPESRFGLLQQLRGEEIGAIEVYPHGHGVPAWAMTPGCGVIVVWTERW